MTEEIDIIARVGGAILLAETEWRPSSPISKERAMALAAIAAFCEPTQAMRMAIWERLEKSAQAGILMPGRIMGSGHADVIMTDIARAALAPSGERKEG